MRLTNDYSDDAVLKVIGHRIAQYRLNQNKTQADIAREAGISSRTIARLEHGESVQASSLFRILRTLKLIENLDALIPEPAISPLQQLKMQGKRRQRASSTADKTKIEDSWQWDDGK